jgi:hypothetical protein
MFVEFEAERPVLTDMVLSAPFVWLVGLLFGLTGIKEVLLKNRTAKATCNTMALLVAFFLGALYVVGIWRPLIVLLDSPSK